MTTAKKYLERLKEREPQIWKEPLEESALTEQDLSEIEKGLGYNLPVPYREFLKNLKEAQGDQFPCSFLEAGFIQIGEIYGYLTFLDLVNGGIVTIHQETVYDMTIVDGVNGENTQELRDAMESKFYICKDFNDLLRLACTGDFLDEDEQRFPTEEELERDYFY